MSNHNTVYVNTRSTLFGGAASITNRDQTVWVSPPIPIRLADRNMNYRTVFNPVTRQVDVYEQRYGIFGTQQGLVESERLATYDPTSGSYTPTQYMKDNFTSSQVSALVNSQATRSSLDNNLRFTIDGGYERVNGKKITNTARADLLGGNPEESTPDNPGSPASGGDGSTNATLQTNTNSSIVGQGNDFKSSSGNANLIYPEGRDQSPDQSQDFVKFTALRYGKRTLSSDNLTFGASSNTPITDTIVYLPLQGSIADSNGVGWNEETINPLQIAGADIAMSTIEAGLPAGFSAVSNIAGKIAGNSEQVKKAIAAVATESAIGANILPRLERAIFNPNTELLFQGPQLRGFTFTFKLTPRSSSEAKIVKDIIKFFKKNMAAKTEGSGLYLVAPNVFSIEYMFKFSTQHKGINLIKDCALQNFSVDYTPDGSYAAYGDGSMFSYNLTMQFMELLPIYSSDYDSGAGASHPIGF